MDKLISPERTPEWEIISDSEEMPNEIYDPLNSGKDVHTINEPTMDHTQVIDDKPDIATLVAQVVPSTPQIEFSSQHTDDCAIDTGRSVGLEANSCRNLSEDCPNAIDPHSCGLGTMKGGCPASDRVRIPSRPMVVKPTFVTATIDKEHQPRLQVLQLRRERTSRQALPQTSQGSSTLIDVHRSRLMRNGSPIGKN